MPMLSRELRNLCFRCSLQCLYHLAQCRQGLNAEMVKLQAEIDPIAPARCVPRKACEQGLTAEMGNFAGRNRSHCTSTLHTQEGDPGQSALLPGHHTRWRAFGLGQWTNGPLWCPLDRCSCCGVAAEHAARAQQQRTSPQIGSFSGRTQRPKNSRKD